MAKKQKPVESPPSSGAVPLEIAFKGDVFTVFFEINNQEVTLHSDPNGGLSKKFADFPPGKINILLHVKGLNTTAWSLILTYGGTKVFDRSAKISGGMSHLTAAVELNEP
jgi:hypothetical protein